MRDETSAVVEYEIEDEDLQIRLIVGLSSKDESAKTVYKCLPLVLKAVNQALDDFKTKEGKND